MPQHSRPLDSILGKNSLSRALSMRPQAILKCLDESYVSRVHPGVVVKHGNSYVGDVTPEVVATLFARSKGLPVPRILHHKRASSDRPKGSIIMEEISGMSLDRVLDSMNTEQLDHVASQIKAIRVAMRRVKPARTMYGAVNGGPFRNHYYPPFLFPKAAFSTAGEFLDYFRRILLLFCTDKFTEGLLSEFPRNAPAVFTHGDLVPPNIMIDGTTITGIIDWATAGFYPEYWEMARMRNPDYMTPNWVYVLNKMYPNEGTREREINAVNRLVSVFAATF